MFGLFIFCKSRSNYLTFYVHQVVLLLRLPVKKNICEIKLWCEILDWCFCINMTSDEFGYIQ